MNWTITKMRKVLMVAVLLCGGATVQAQVQVGGSVFGGGNEANVGGNTSVSVNQEGAKIGYINGTPNSAANSGGVYGGGAKADVGTDNSNTTTVTLLNGTVGGNVFGGGLGDGTHAPKVNGVVTVNVGSDVNTGEITLLGSVYGCNNASGSPQDNVTVHIYSTNRNAKQMFNCTDNCEYAIANVFGGGRKADYEPENGDVNSTKKTKVYVHGCDNTVQNVFGGGDAADATGVEVEIDGGRFDYVFGGGNGAGSDDPAAPDYNPGANIGVGGATLAVHGGKINNLFGGSNEKGEFEGESNVSVDNSSGCIEDIDDFFGGSNKVDLGKVDHPVHINTTISCGTKFNNVYGGCNEAKIINGSVTLNILGGEMNNVFGGSRGVANTTAANINGDVTLNLYGGTITNAFGGSDANGNITGKITVNVLDYGHTEDDGNGGTRDCALHVNNIYGAGNQTSYHPTNSALVSPVVNLFHGTVTKSSATDGNVFGGGLGDTAVVVAYPVVNVGYNSATMNDTLTHITLSKTGYTMPSSFAVTAEGAVYGGGDAAPVTGNTTVLMQNSTSTVNKLFGGGNNIANGLGVSGTTTVTVNGGTITGSDETTHNGVYGGCNTNGNVGGLATVNINGGTFGTNTTDSKIFVHGGGYGENTTTSGSVEVNVGNGSETPTIYGDVYGGSALGTVNGTGASYNTTNTTNHTYVNLVKGTVNGSLYGGGLGDANHEANVYSPVTVTVTTGTVTGAVYGCNNINGSPKSTVQVDINGTDQPATGYAIAKVFGGGNQADYDGIPEVEIHNCNNKIEYVYGGGNSAKVKGTNVTIWGGNTIDNVFGGCYGDDVTTSGTNVTIHGGTINHVYGGNNQSGSINGAINVTVNKATESGHSSCDMVLDEVYGGGNVAASNAGNITIGCTGTGAGEGINYLYGGANQANITSSIELTIEEGSIAHVFGGNNTSGTIAGSITVNINKKASPCVWNIGDVYGGGNLAPYSNVSNYPVVNVKNGTVSGSVFGGGYGSSAIVTGNPQVTVGDPTAGTAAVTGDVYGGGDAAGVTGNPTVTIQKAGTTVGNAFGGGNAAAITGATTLTMTDGVAGNLYGGGNQAGVSNTATVNVNGGAVSTGVYGGCNSSGEVTGAINVYVNGGTVGTSTSNTAYGVFGGGFGSNTTTGGNVTVTIGNDNNLTPTIYGNIYGGSAEGRVNASTTNLTKVWLKKGNIYGDLYGGGFGDNDANALVNGSVQVVVDGGTVSANATNGGRVFGCNNANGAPQGTVAVNVTGGTMQSVMGGGNLAAYSGTPAITISNGTITNQVIGGGNQAGVGGSSISISGGTIATGSTEERGVYGGCNTSGEVGGNIIVSITNGTIGADGTPANVHGGGYGNGTSTTGNVAVTINGANVNIWGDVYGGSAKGHVNDAAADKTDVTLKNGTIHGSLYGGGLGDNTYAATVNGAVQVTVEGGSVTGSVYGCNNANGAPQSTVKVDIYGTATPASGYALGNVFGGGNLAAYTGTPEVTIHNCNNSIEYIYGGGNKASVAATNVTIYGGNTIGEVYAGGNGEGVAANYTMVSGNANAYIRGGKIGKVFGGNNASGTIGGSITVDVNKGTEEGHSSCDMYIAEVYGGGNHAASAAGSVSIGCTGTFTQAHGLHPENIGTSLEGIGTVYGGANDADVTGNITLSITSGIIKNVFGGNNVGHTVNGNIQVLINKDDSKNCGWYIGNVYGGGNQATYGTAGNNYPVVQIQNGTVSGDVFGGGLGDANDPSKGVVTGNPQVTVNHANAVVTGGVYGGGSLAPTTGSPVVTLTNGALTKVYGGGKAASVTGAPTVNINGGTVSAGLYGGCDSQGTVDGNITVSVTGGTIGASGAGKSADVYGGGYGAPTSTTGNVDVTVDGGTIWGDIYGGSAFGTVNTYNASKTTTVNILDGTLHGNVFGGGLGENGNTTKGVVNGAVVVNIGSDVNTGNATLTGCSVYGCNNTGGSPKDNVTVNIYKTAAATAPAYAIANVFGGGNKASYQPTGTNNDTTTTVHIYGCDNSVERVFGGSNAAASGSNTRKVKVATVIDGGRFNEIYGGGNGDPTAADIYGSVDLAIHGGVVNQFFVGSNKQGSVSGASTVAVDKEGSCAFNIVDFFCGGNYADISGDVVTTIACEEGIVFRNLYGGCNMADVTGNVSLTVNGGTYDTIYGGSKGDANKSADIGGNVTLNIYGGTVHDAIFGGSNVNGSIAGNITVTVENQQGTGDCALNVANADVYGAGNLAIYTAPVVTNERPNNPVVNINHATVRNVFGGGKGDETSDETKGSVIGNPKVNIGDNNDGHTATVTQNVYGGGNAAKVSGNTTVLMQNGHSSANKIFGGGNQAGVTGATTVTVNGGTLNGSTDATHNGVYGGCNASGNVGGLATLNINGGTFGTNTTNSKIFVHGGGYGENTTTSGSVEVNVGNGTATPTIYGDVYGGSALGTVNGTGASYNTTNTTNHTYVNLVKGTVNGSLYGGGLGAANHEANVYSPVTVTVTTGTVTGAVYGCNNINGSPQSTVQVDIDGTSNTGIANVFGGGNLAQYSGSPVVNVKQGTVGNVFGGGKGELATGNDRGVKGKVTGNPQVTIGQVSGSNVVNISGDVYGGGDAAHVAGTPVVLVQNSYTTVTGSVYGGGNAADVTGSNVTVNDGTIANVFGGGHGDKNTANKYADVNGDDTLTIGGGIIDKVFGGSNSKGSITGKMGMRINKTGSLMKIKEVYGGGNEADGKAGNIYIGCTGDLVALGANEHYGVDQEGIRYVYGGANQANVSNNIALNINSGIVENVFGGNNTSGTISGSIQVNINKTGDCGWYVGNVYGGGNEAPYSGTPDVNIIAGTVSGNVYGGGNKAGVGGGDVSMTGGAVLLGLYGGCNTSGEVTGSINVNINGGTVGTSTSSTAYGVFGGGFGAGTTTSGNVTVTIGDGTSAPTIYGDVYGGSAEGNVNDDIAEITKVWLKSGTVYGDLYGGGFGDNSSEALVNGSVQVVVDGGKVNALNASRGGRVFGCNNAKGTPKGTVEVSINSTEATTLEGNNKVYALQAVYGGGNLAHYDPTTPGNYPTVTVNGCNTSIKDVFGGGNAAAVPYTNVTIYGGDIYRVFAGGNGESGTAANVGYKNSDDTPTTDSYGAGTTNASIKGGTIVKVFGGSNSKGAVRASGTLDIDKRTSGNNICEMKIEEVYGGGNLAAGAPSTLTIGCTGAKVALGDGEHYGVDKEGIRYVYGGANAAAVTGNIVLNINSGIVENVFGGNNVSGAIDGTIQVNINKTSESNSCGWYVGDVYGGGNQADYSGTPIVQIQAGTVSGNVYGGGNNITTASKGVYGSDVRVSGGQVNGNVYGGCNTKGYVENNSSVDLTGGTVEGSVFGGGKGVNTVVHGKATVHIRGADTQVGADVYGGGDEGQVEGGTEVKVLEN